MIVAVGAGLVFFFCFMCVIYSEYQREKARRPTWGERIESAKDMRVVYRPVRLSDRRD